MPAQNQLHGHFGRLLFDFFMGGVFSLVWIWAFCFVWYYWSFCLFVLISLFVVFIWFGALCLLVFFLFANNPFGQPLLCMVSNRDYFILCHVGIQLFSTICSKDFIFSHLILLELLLKIKQNVIYFWILCYWSAWVDPMPVRHSWNYYSFAQWVMKLNYMSLCTFFFLFKDCIR